MHVTVRGHGGTAALEICSYENEAATNLDDANWLSCHVDVELHGFSAHVAASFTTHDLIGFRDKLSNVLSSGTGCATLSNYEQSVCLTITAMPHGRATINGFVNRKDSVRARLEFTIGSDLTFFLGALAEINTAVAAFPPKGST